MEHLNSTNNKIFYLKHISRHHNAMNANATITLVYTVSGVNVELEFELLEYNIMNRAHSGRFYHHTQMSSCTFVIFGRNLEDCIVHCVGISGNNNSFTCSSLLLQVSD